MKNNFACSLRYFREKERVTRCALHVFHSVKRTANNFVINCIKLSVRKTVYAPASSRVCGTINWTARARFVFFFPLFPPLFFFILFLHRAGEFDVSNSQDALIRFYRPLVQILGIHIDCNWNEKYEIRRWFVVFRSNKLAIFKNMQKEETVYRRCALYRREKKGTGGGGKKKKRITP